MAQIICQDCKRSNQEDARFCSGCGKPLPPQVAPEANKPKPVEIFLSYSHADEDLKNQFLKHMAILGRGRADLALIWHDRDIEASENWRQQIDTHLALAKIILLLISADFIASDYCYSNEMETAMKRHERNEAKVVPIIVRPVEWDETPFHKLQALPRGAKPVIQWASRDEAWVDVVKNIKKIL